MGDIGRYSASSREIEPEKSLSISRNSTITKKRRGTKPEVSRA